MSGPATLATLALIFTQLSLLAFGGGASILPEMQRHVVQVHPWMTGEEFAALYALAQAAPGPTLLITTLIGWRMAGLGGAMVATLSVCAPTSVLTFFSANVWHRFRDAEWRALAQRGLLPVTAGLIMASAAVLTRSTTTGWQTAVLTAGATTVFLLTRVHPLIVLAAGAALGVLGLLG